jgi:hypothetical protein
MDWSNVLTAYMDWSNVLTAYMDGLQYSSTTTSLRHFRVHFWGHAPLALAPTDPDRAPAQGDPHAFQTLSNSPKIANPDVGLGRRCQAVPGSAGISLAQR